MTILYEPRFHDELEQVDPYYMERWRGDGDDTNDGEFGDDNFDEMPCPDCYGTGMDCNFKFPCEHCDGRGWR